MPTDPRTSYSVICAGGRVTTETEIKRSRFIGHVVRVHDEESARAALTEIRSAHREARHVCHAFVCGPKREIQRSSDDGEPAGSAGQPILTAILERHTRPGLRDLSDVLVVVVRYFGGIKLGFGGLVQAYTQSAVMTLDDTTVGTRRMMRRFRLRIDYRQAPRLESLLRSHDCGLQEVAYGDRGVDFHLMIVDDNSALTRLNSRIARWTDGTGVLLAEGGDWLDECR